MSNYMHLVSAFEMARGKKACIIYFDEVDAIGGAQFDDGAGGDNEVQRTMLELINQLDGFDARRNEADPLAQAGLPQQIGLFASGLRPASLGRRPGTQPSLSSSV